MLIVSNIAISARNIVNNYCQNPGIITTKHMTFKVEIKDLHDIAEIVLKLTLYTKHQSELKN